MLYGYGNWQEFNQDDNGDAAWDLEKSRTHNAVNELTAIGLQILACRAVVQVPIGLIPRLTQRAI